jgi:Fur family peroxide stress response transcriptional regulator
MAKRNYSSKRNAIYNAVCSTKTHPSAKWIYDTLKPDIPDLSLGTVYRNIALFKEEGKVNVVCTVNGEERIDGNTKSHPHFVCNNCGKVYDVSETSLTLEDYRELEKAGFNIESKYVLYYVICT